MGRKNKKAKQAMPSEILPCIDTQNNTAFELERCSYYLLAGAEAAQYAVPHIYLNIAHTLVHFLYINNAWLYSHLKAKLGEAFDADGSVFTWEQFLKQAQELLSGTLMKIVVDIYNNKLLSACMKDGQAGQYSYHGLNECLEAERDKELVEYAEAADEALVEYTESAKEMLVEYTKSAEEIPAEHTEPAEEAVVKYVKAGANQDYKKADNYSVELCLTETVAEQNSHKLFS
ncbi:hypothetical protein CISG_06406 [Coccidioides immitis RMSCC 3703]|uniref:Uncharacterized protein n=1 Tax=Coccidioides immitis RMSCC 3703 TaxID=454286 RepID=A0A0J8R3I3_COCIT|nr:hypothetical protein CISG_06406 [Coccidioides immitis RMSCC 3703]